MKRLFAVKNGRGDLVDNPKTNTPWFDNKMEAKTIRDKLTIDPPYTITRGPDHIGPHDNHNKRRKNKRSFLAEGS